MDGSSAFGELTIGSAVVVPVSPGAAELQLPSPAAWVSGGELRGGVSAPGKRWAFNPALHTPSLGLNIHIMHICIYARFMQILCKNMQICCTLVFTRFGNLLKDTRENSHKIHRRDLREICKYIWLQSWSNDELGEAPLTKLWLYQCLSRCARRCHHDNQSYLLLMQFRIWTSHKLFLHLSDVRAKCMMP